MASLDFDLEESQFRSWYAAQAVALEDACAALTARVAAVVTQAGGVDTTKVEGRVKDVVFLSQKKLGRIEIDEGIGQYKGQNKLNRFGIQGNGVVDKMPHIPVQNSA